MSFEGTLVLDLGTNEKNVEFGAKLDFFKKNIETFKRVRSSKILKIFTISRQKMFPAPGCQPHFYLQPNNPTSMWSFWFFYDFHPFDAQNSNKSQFANGPQNDSTRQIQLQSGFEPLICILYTWASPQHQFGLASQRRANKYVYEMSKISRSKYVINLPFYFLELVRSLGVWSVPRTGDVVLILSCFFSQTFAKEVC